MLENYKGYSLFKDVEDEALQLHNRASVMANMFEDNISKEDQSSTSKKGALLIFGYMNEIDKKERGQLVTAFHEKMKERGFKHVG